jgi:hypothetical protein
MLKLTKLVKNKEKIIMKKYVLILAILTAFSANSLVFAKTTIIKQYDKHGNYQGKYVSDGTKTKIYKKNGNYDGYYKQSGNKIKKYAKNGNLEGSYKTEK